MRQLRSKHKNYFLLLLLLALTPTSCDRIINSPIPDVYVYFPINLSIVNELTVAGYSVYFSGVGYAGVIVCCEQPGVYYAYDAACTEEASRSCIVEAEGFLAECPCCGSRYLLNSNGYPASPPTTIPLKQYQVTVLNAYELLVYN